MRLSAVSSAGFPERIFPMTTGIVLESIASIQRGRAFVVGNRSRRSQRVKQSVGQSGL